MLITQLCASPLTWDVTLFLGYAVTIYWWFDCVLICMWCTSNKFYLHPPPHKHKMKNKQLLSTELVTLLLCSSTIAREVKKPTKPNTYNNIQATSHIHRFDIENIVSTFLTNIDIDCQSVNKYFCFYGFNKYAILRCVS